MIVKLARIWSILLVLLLAAQIINVGYQRLTSGNNTVRYLILSSRDKSLDGNILQAIQADSRLTYARQDSEFGSSMLKHLKIEEPPGLVLVTDSGSESVSVETDLTRILATIDAGPEQSAQLPAFAIAALIGAWIGAIFSTIAQRAAGWILAIGASAAWWKWTHECPTCPVATILNLNASFVGFVFLATLAFMAALGKSSTIRQVVLLGVCSTASWQFYAVATSASVTCLPCSIIAGVCFTLICAHFFNRSKEQTVSPYSRRTVVVLAASIASFAALTTSVFPSSPVTDGRPQVASEPQPLKNWKGANLRDMGITMHEPLSGPTLIYVGRSTCPPCVEAKTYLNTRPDIPCAFLELPAPGQTNDSAQASITFNQGTFVHTPTFLTVTKDGTILSIDLGWTNDKMWIDSFVDTVKRTLQMATRSGK